MLHKFFEHYPDVESAGTPDPELVERYADLLPAEVLHIWKTHGFATLMGGYLKIVPPDAFEDLMRSAYTPLREPAYVFAATAMADLWIWEDQSVMQLNFRHGRSEVIGRRTSTFFNGILTSWPYVESKMRASPYRAAVELLGPPDFDECFGYVPMLALGGSEAVEKLRRVKLKEHVSLLAGAIGTID